jgi:hypothetical protein
MTDMSRTDTTEAEAVAKALRVVTRLRIEDIEAIADIPGEVFHEVLSDELRRADETPWCGR